MRLLRFIPALFLLVLLITLGSKAETGAAKSESLNVTIARPSEGETFYFGPSSLLYNISITGAVTSAEGDLEKVKLTLEIIHEGSIIGRQTIHPYPAGNYVFLATVNPGHNVGQLDSRRYMGLTDGCGGNCHASRATELHLVPGSLLLWVTAEDKQGNQASASRRIVVDGAELAQIPVEVVHESSPDQPLADIPVDASTWIYMWRARNYSVASDSSSFANLTVEALSQAPTRYVLRVQPVVVDGVYYEGVEPVMVTLPPGTKDVAPVTLEVSSQSGTIEGRFTAPDGLSAGANSFTIWAFAREHDYYVKGEPRADGRYTLSDLPIDEYIVTVDATQLAQIGLEVEPVIVDLKHSPTAEVKFRARKRTVYSLPVAVLGDERPLPFAWLSLPEAQWATRVNPAAEQAYLDTLERGNQTVIVTAPGYYSLVDQVSVPGNTSRPTALTLKPHPDSYTLEWGNGQVFVPAGSLVETGIQGVVLEKGWLWGSGGTGHPLFLHTGHIIIRLYKGEFALETRQNGGGIFYLFHGRAQVVDPGRPQPLSIDGKQMVLLETMQTVPLEPGVVAALVSDNAELPSPIWEPGLQARLRDQLVLIGIGSARFITFVTYIFGVLSVVILPLLLLILGLKRRAYQKHSKQLN